MSPAASSSRPRVLYLGAVSTPRDGTLGGQLMATRYLMETPIRDLIDWQFVDSSQRSQPPPGFIIRAILAFRRVVQSICILLSRRTKASLIFVPYLTASLCEKLLVAWFSGLVGKRTIVTFRSEIKPQGRFERMLRPFFRRGLMRCDSILVQSDLAKAALEQLYPGIDVSIEVMPNWISSDRPQRDFAHLPTSEIPPRILFIGWLEKAKGTGELLEAAKLLKDRGRKFKLTFCGSGSQADELPEEAQKLGAVEEMEFLGWIDEPRKEELFQLSELLVLPSHTEGMPNAILEAMTAGLPIVATKVGSIPQLVVDGEGGYLVDPQDVASLANGMESLLKSPELRERMGRFNRQRVLNNHDVEKAWRRIATLLNVEYPNGAVSVPSATGKHAPISR